MLVHSFLLPRLAPLLLLAAESAVLIQSSHAEPLAARPAFLKRRGEHASPTWPDDDRESITAIQEAIAVRKMMDNEGQMFLHHYWHFDQDGDRPYHSLNEPETSATNASVVFPFHAPFALHRDTDTAPSYLHRARGLLSDRAFQCPSDTDPCTGINRPNSCCPSGSSCQLVTDSGQGDVACCGSGQTCSGNVQSCADGYQNCPGNAGGGCCVPGYACVGTIGCVHSSTTTVIVNPQVTASPPTTSTTSSFPSGTTTSLEPLPPPPATTSTSQATVTTSTTSSATSPPSSSSSSSPTITTTSNALVAPARPTSAAIVTTHFLSASPLACPTGFYQCSAYYQGGCCRVGRDCGLTDCPASGSTTVAQGNGVTVVAPTGINRGSGGSGCAQGWQTCGADVGGGCCPPGGFECGTESCTKGIGSKVTGTGGVSVAKAADGTTNSACKPSVSIMGLAMLAGLGLWL